MGTPAETWLMGTPAETWLMGTPTETWLMGAPTETWLMGTPTETWLMGTTTESLIAHSKRLLALYECIYVCHDSCICVAWLVYTCATTQTYVYVYHDSFICVPWLMFMCTMIRLYVCQRAAKDISLKLETQDCTTNPEIPPRKAEFPIFYKLRIGGWGGLWVANIDYQHCMIVFYITSFFIQFCWWYVILIERHESKAQNAPNLETNVRL